MQIKKSIPLIIDYDESLVKTCAAFLAVKQAVSGPCFNQGKPLHYLKLHKLMYNEVKGIVHSQMIQNALRLVAGTYHALRKKKIQQPLNFKKPSALFLIGKLGYDASFPQDGSLSIWTVDGRKRVSFRVHSHYQHDFDNSIKNSITVTPVRGQPKLKVQLTITLEVPDPKGIHSVGVDLNETNALVAVDHTGHELFITGKRERTLNKRNRKTVSRVQAKLASHKAQKKSTRSVRRVLKRLGRKRSNRTRTFVQTTAKKLVTWCPADSVIVLEGLSFKKAKKAIKTKNPKVKALRRRLSAWPYGLMRDWITQKAAERGLAVATVNPAFTSQNCSVCGLRGVRKRHKFNCPACGHSGHADVNAAVNIRNRHTVLRNCGPPVGGPRSSDS